MSDAMPPAAPILALDRVSLSFGSVVALSGVSLALHPGRVLALVGESGSGKTTAARVLAGLHRPQVGRVLFRGRDRSQERGRAAETAFRSAVQMVFQDPFASLNPVHRVAHHVARPLRLHRRLHGATLDAAVVEVLGRVGLDPEETVRKFPHELSGGQRQRVNIARALATGAEAIIADEPTSMLDVSLRLGILGLIRELKARHGVAFLYITHDIATARHVAEDIAVMRAGRVVEWGDAAAVIDAPRHPYTRLLLAAVPDPERRFSAGAEVTGGTGPEVGDGAPTEVGPGHFVLA